MNKTALITGATSGIGAQIARRLAHDGFNVAINARSQAELPDGKAVAEDCKKENVSAVCFIADVSVYDECQRMVKEVKGHFGSLDVLVNNAGITRDGLMARMKEEAYDTVIAVNQKSVFNMMKFAGNVMIKQHGGRIINISSVAGLYGNAGQINYSASKAAVIGMTKTASKELGSRGITVNAVAPGFIQTPMTDMLTDEQKANILKQVSLGRYGQVSEVAAAVSFLASDEAGYITGQVLEISGGLAM
ncbi:MAG: 3-oxoacyl-[acyl-carrier-protein] reductase [Oscillospiraceae bacterium]|jgi:3-oxoacyl-[acyl-carrier protein] reductase|nr:3-oxoacyl-[acyl-carrier-protein] reductase [Oscillospiraceae bacterium]